MAMDLDSLYYGVHTRGLSRCGMVGRRSLVQVGSVFIIWFQVSSYQIGIKVKSIIKRSFFSGFSFWFSALKEMSAYLDVCLLDTFSLFLAEFFGLVCSESLDYAEINDWKWQYQINTINNGEYRYRQHKHAAHQPCCALSLFSLVCPSASLTPCLLLLA